jgi:RNA polymerase sigma-70 factor (ECF subfamily)
MLFMHEETLIDLLKAGDENAFKLIYDQNKDKVINICYRFTGNRETSEDLTQEVFIEVYRSVKHFRKGSKLSTWIYKIATTRSIDYVRTQKSKKRFAFLSSLHNNVKLKEKLADHFSQDPETKLEDEDRKKILDWALNTLPENQRIAFTLSKYDELSYKEIAEVLETSLASVESLIHRAKKNLEIRLTKYFKKII